MLSVVIPSKNAANLTRCADAVRKHEPNVRIIVVDDGLGSVVVPEWTFFVDGIKPFVFSRNVNIGIKAAGTDDVVILNDDALLQVPGGFSILQEAAQEHPEYGLIASTCRNVGNSNQWPQLVGLREDPRMVCFVAVLIPRRTIDAVGPLDEQFTAYGFDDDDYCLRVRRSGLKIGIHDGCYVDHSTLASTFRGPDGPGGQLESGYQIFLRKWGTDNHAL